MSQTSEDTSALAEELRNIVDHAEALLGALADDGDPKLASLRERVSSGIETARTHLDEMQEAAERPAEKAAAALDRWIGENPWKAVAVGAGIGLAIGVLLAARRRRRAPADADSGPR